MKRIVLAVVLFAEVGCVDVAVPDDARILCDDDGSCPEPLSCEPASNLCVRSLVGEELTPPAALITPSLVGGPFLEAEGTIAVELVFLTPPLEPPTVDLVVDDAVVTAFDVAGSGLDFSATLTASSALLGDKEGRLAVVVSAIDARGLPRRFVVGVVELDLSAPVLGNVSLQRLPDPRLTPVAFDIAEDTVVGPATSVRLGFSLNEAASADDPPSAWLDGSPLVLVRDAAVDNPVTFAVDWDNSVGVVDGSFDVVVRVVDEAGNAVEQVVGVLELDVTPPPPPPVDVDGAVVFERAPWGRVERAGPDVYTVVGAAGVVEDDSIVLITRDAAGAREIGRTRATADGFGGVDELLLATGDLRGVFIVVADRAGNVSAPVAVEQSRWIASPGGKIVGDAIGNPHRFEGLPILLPQLEQSGITEHDESDGLGAVDDDDGDDVVTFGAGTFVARPSDDGDALVPPSGSALVGTTIGHDPVRGVTVVFGGSLLIDRIEGSSKERGEDVACEGAIDDVWVRRGDGRFRRITLRDGARPPPMATGRFVFDTRRNELVLIGVPEFVGLANSSRPPEMWSFDGVEFRQLCTDATCAASMPVLSGMGLVNDPVRHVLVAHGGGLGEATFEFDGRVWRAVCGDGCTEAPGGVGSLVWDDVARRVVWFDGTTLSSWDGVTWTPLCTDAACTASAPPPRSNTSAAWDRRRQRLVTFGGDNPAGDYPCNVVSQSFNRTTAGVPDTYRAAPPYADTWEFDGSTWTQRVPTTSPPSRAQHQLSWDERAQAILLIGGDDCACSSRTRDPGFRAGVERDAWEFDGTDWRRVDLVPAPPPGFLRRPPLPLAFHSLVPSTGLITGESRGVLAFGDQAQELVWIDDGRFYEATTAPSPSGNKSLAPLADDDDGNLYVFNGGTPFPFIFDGTGTRTACSPDPFCGAGSGPTPPFFGYAAAHDGERFVVFGGAQTLNTNFGARFSDTALARTLVFSATTGLQEVCGDTSCGPAARVRGQLAKSTTPGELVLFGGFPGDQSTWTFDGTTWTEHATGLQPQQRQDMLLTFDPERDAVFMTGGTDEDPDSDTRNEAPQRALPAFLELVYEWTDRWSEARVADPEGDGRPSARFAAAAAADPAGGVTIQGGVPSPQRVIFSPPGDNRVADVWTWNGGSGLQAAQRFRVTTRVAGRAEDEAVTGAVVRWYTTVLRDDEPTGDQPELLVWSGAAWTPLAATICGAGCFEARLDAALTSQSLVGPAEELVVAVRAPANGAAPGYFGLRSDFVEVSVATTRRPLPAQ